MNLVAAQTMMDGAGIAIGWDLTQLETRQEQMQREAFSLGLQELWEAWWWEYLMVAEQMPGATWYAAGTAFAAQEFCYFPGTQKYYQALVASTGNAPALYANGGWTTNTAFWADAKSRIEAADFVVGVNDTGLLVGAQVRNPGDGLYYQLYAYNAGCVVSGAGDAGANAEYLPGVDGNGRPQYAQVGQPITISCNYVDNDPVTGNPRFAWALIDVGGVEYQQVSTGTLPTAMPPVTNPWSIAGNGALPLPLVTGLTGYNACPNPANWAPVIPFTPVVAVPGTVRSVTMHDPRGSLAPRPYPFQKSGEGVEIFGLLHGEPWFWYRRVTPIITGDAFDPAVAYDATPADQLVFDS